MRIADASSRMVLRSHGGVVERALPRRTYLQGRIPGRPDSRALVIVGADGDLRGLVRQAGDVRALRAESTGPVLASVDTKRAAEPFRCGADSQRSPPPPAPASERGRIRAVPADGYLARVAFETDHEYFRLFDSADDAAAYAMDLVAFASTIYSNESSTRMALSTIHLWTDPSDPWDQSDTICTLFEFGKYWNDNRTDDRTVAHFLSGKRLGGGVAWLGTLCGSGFNVDTANAGCKGFDDAANYGGDYGVSASLSGNFDLSDPAAVWDIVVVSHEIGHNFDSPHTHCYAGIGGNAQPVDECYAGEDACYSGATSLPGPQGAGSGTIMSYCHLLSGGLSNIGLTLGLDHAYGVAPDRVPDRMMAAAIDAEATYPGCLTTELGAELSLSASDTRLVEGEELALSLLLDRPVDGDVVVDLVEDASLSGNLSNLAGHRIPSGTTRLDVILSTVDDSTYTGTRSGELSIDTVGSDAAIDIGVGTLPITVTDDEPPSVTLTAAGDRSEVTEGGSLDITVTLDRPTTVPVEVSLQPDAALDGRIADGLGPLTIPAGDESVRFSVAFADNGIDEPDLETAIAIGEVASGAQTFSGNPDRVAFTLLDNDAPPVVLTLALDRDSVGEDESLLATVSLNRPATVPLEASLAATSALAARISSGLEPQTIEPGATQATFVLRFIDDARFSQTELYGRVAIAELASETEAKIGIPAERLVRLIDDDAPPDSLVSASFEGISP